MSDEFKANKYAHLKGFLDKESCRQLSNVLRDAAEKDGWYDHQCPTSKSIRDNPTFDQLLLDLKPHFEEATGLKLLPTYAYARLYKPGEILKNHQDRPACEISATVTLGFDGHVWPIFVSLDEEKNRTYINMEVGDAVVYRGTEVYHGRDEYTQGKWQAQVFLHYVDANGPHTEWIYDKRGKLNLPNPTDLTMWVYNDVLTEKDCDALVRLYTQAESHEAGIGGENASVVKEVRNVNRVILPVYKGIGARLAAVGLDANAQRWKFDIKRANQSEFLRYPSGGGRYKGHLDTFLDNSQFNLDECRKVTVLAFLNDDYKGGKFFLQTGHEKIYPPQKKGTVIAFPSFLLHGVEDVEEGERYSVVTWLVGPWFK